MSALSRSAGDMLAAEIILRGKSDAPHLFSLSARLALPGRDIQGNAVHENLYTAIHQLVAKLARLSRKRKTRLAKKFKRARRYPAADSTVQWPPRGLFAPLKSKS
jgi:ribosome-associated translation inhibitor RaiA